MKTNKALKRLAKIEALMSDVAKRYAAHSPHLREVFAELKAAVDRVTEVVKGQVSSAGTNAGTKKKAAAPKKAAVKAKSAAAGKRGGRPKVVAKAPVKKAAKHRTSVRKVARKKAANATAKPKAVPVSPRGHTGYAAQESIAAPLS